MKHLASYLHRPRWRSLETDFIAAGAFGLVAFFAAGLFFDPALPEVLTALGLIASVLTFFGFLVVAALHDIRAALYRHQPLSTQEEPK